MKVIAYDINEIWSLDVAYVDKLAKENTDVICLLIAVDCLSRYLPVKPLLPKYATTRADAFKKMIKNKRPKKKWEDAGTDFKGPSCIFVRKMKPNLIKRSARKIDFCRDIYTVARDFDIQVFRGQMDILV